MSELPSETVFLTPPANSSDTEQSSWWQAYQGRLEASGLSTTARSVVEADSRYILERGLLGAGAPGSSSWPDARIRRGLVMGSVQSGKTASMLGVSALALDARIDAVVILAGTRLSLWRQTLERLQSQLDCTGTELQRDMRRLLLPRPAHVLGEDLEVPLSRLYACNGQQARRAIRQHRPLIAVVMKNIHHLRALGETLHDHIYPAVNAARRPFHLLVLDDEADDGSILDARVESGLDPALGDLKQVPRAIVDLWEARPHTGAPASPHLYVTYVGYTATPQANFLQSDHNPLAPKDFVVALRTPLDRGSPTQRTTTFSEPRGLPAYYTGGEIFYRRAEGAKLCVATGSDRDSAVGDAVRAFLVAGAIRRLRDVSRLPLSVASSTIFASPREAAAQTPRPHSMLVHPSAAIEDQFAAATAILEWAGVADPELIRQNMEAGGGRLPVDSLSANVLSHQELWSSWVDRYRVSARELRLAFDLPVERQMPDWLEVRRTLLEEVIPATRLAVVNSDPRADDRPQFDPWFDGVHWRAAKDLSTIFVSGNVMSRGLTLEGLTTTLFLRRTDDPYADTQMQMQRWFGYRGDYLEFCRVFLPQEQLDLFRSYHETDEALRRQVVRLMNESPERAPGPQVLQGRHFLATGKLTNVSNAPLCPGASPFVRLMNDGVAEDPNAQLLARTFRTAGSSDVVVNGKVRGRMLDEPLSLPAAAALLDALLYDSYKPGGQGWQASRWSAVESHIGLDEDHGGFQPLYRPQSPPGHEAPSEVRTDCPYALGAYLRLWAACLNRHARGLVPTDDPRLPWSMLDLERKRREQPVFHVGIRYGSGTPIESGCLGDLPFMIRPMQRSVADGQLAATWGSRNPGSGADPYFGDAFFDYHIRGEAPPRAPAGEPPWRPVGAPGLILFHVIEGHSANPTVAVGLGIPLGGPDQFAARGAS